MRIAIMTDLEGVSGVVSFENQTGPGGRYYEAARQLLTGEVNAAVEGLEQEGVEDVLVIDGHGCGAVVLDQLRPLARLMHGGSSFLAKSALELYPAFDATMMIGQHSMAGTPNGCMAHTQNTNVEYYKLNGRMIGELGQWALFCGGFGVPMIFLAGDDLACREAEELIPGIVTAAVKQSLARESAISLSPPTAHDLIRRKVRQAVKAHKKSPLPPLKFSPPYELEVCLKEESMAKPYLGSPNWEKVNDRTVRRRADDIHKIIY
jgi:D-amino peptidase